MPASLAEAVAVLEEERQSRAAAADTLSADLERRLPRVPILRLPFIEATAPEAVVIALSRELATHLAALLPE